MDLLVKNQILMLQENGPAVQAAYADMKIHISPISLQHTNSAPISFTIKWSLIPISLTNITVKFSQPKNMSTCSVQFMECENAM